MSSSRRTRDQEDHPHMPPDTDPNAAYERLIAATWQYLTAAHFPDVDDPHSAAEHELAEEEMQLAARAYAAVSDVDPNYRHDESYTAARDRLTRDVLTQVYRRTVGTESTVFAESIRHSVAQTARQITRNVESWTAGRQPVGWSPSAASGQDPQ